MGTLATVSIVVVSPGLAAEGAALATRTARVDRVRREPVATAGSALAVRNCCATVSAAAGGSSAPELDPVRRATTAGFVRCGASGHVRRATVRTGMGQVGTLAGTTLQRVVTVARAVVVEVVTVRLAGAFAASVLAAGAGTPAMRVAAQEGCRGRRAVAAAPSTDDVAPPGRKGAAALARGRTASSSRMGTVTAGGTPAVGRTEGPPDPTTLLGIG